MIEKIYTILSDGFDPYYNLALEEELLHSVKPNECILYLWQNAKTVVVGRNQNCWKECKVSTLEEDGGHLVRRLSGGGAVFHDLGNLNFTFLVNEKNYSVDRQLEVIVQGVKGIGLEAIKSGRNDIVIDGKKFSGNAFYRHKGQCYHHGTILIDVNKEMLAQYLNVAPEKLSMKGVDSVRSRVVNLVELKPEVTVKEIEKQLLEAFSSVYGLLAEDWVLSPASEEKIMERRAFFASPEWKYGKSSSFDYTCAQRFLWGDLTLDLKVEGGKISDAQIHSDGMDIDFFAIFPVNLIGKAFSSSEMSEVVAQMKCKNEIQKEMQRDIVDFLKSQEV